MGGSYRSYNAPHTTIVQPHTTIVRPSFGWGFGAPVALYSPAPVMVSGYGGGGSGIFTLLILGIFAFVAYQAVTGGFGGYESATFDNQPSMNAVYAFNSVCWQILYFFHGSFLRSFPEMFMLAITGLD
jgi:uncharacterized membrane protein